MHVSVISAASRVRDTTVIVQHRALQWSYYVSKQFTAHECRAVEIGSMA